jgi:SOS-response transcriptional repressor LexA
VTAPTSRIPEVAARDLAIHEFMRAYVVERGFPPLLSEIQAEFGLANPHHARQCLARLERVGLIRLRGGWRGIELVDPEAGAA